LSSPRKRGPIFQRRWLWVPAFAGTTVETDTPSRLRAVKVVLRRRTPDAGLAPGPPLGPLPRVAVPPAPLRTTELLILHLVELAEELDDLLILVAMVSGDVVSRAVPQRAPDDRDLFLAHDLA